MSRALLDVNVLLSLLDRDHVDHLRARQWIEREQQHGWASCAITQNGFVRIVSQPRYPQPLTPAEAVHRLGLATAHPSHESWPCDLSLLDPAHVDRERLLSPRQVTDVYLLALAAHHGGRFVTFDRGVASAAAVGAEAEHLLVL